LRNLHCEEGRRIRHVGRTSEKAYALSSEAPYTLIWVSLRILTRNSLEDSLTVYDSGNRIFT
jgi:hypothetical protein